MDFTIHPVEEITNLAAVFQQIFAGLVVVFWIKVNDHIVRNIQKLLQFTLFFGREFICFQIFKYIHVVAVVKAIPQCLEPQVLWRMGQHPPK